MNTPSHIIINLAILRRSPFDTANWGSAWSSILGAIAPDAAIFGFYAWTRWIQQMPDRIIWQDAYYEPFWQNIFAVGNSIPLVGLGLAICYWRRWRWGILFCLSMLLHHACDLPLHNDDAHRHFWPLSNVRIVSPVSYWDPNHFGSIGALSELSLVLIASAALLQQLRSPISRGLLLLLNGLLVVGYLVFYVLPQWIG